MSFAVYLTNAQIQQRHHIDVQSDLLIKKETLIDPTSIAQLIFNAKKFSNANSSTLKWDEAFYQKFNALPAYANEEMQQSVEYQNLKYFQNLSTVALETITSLKEKGYVLRKI